MARPRKYDDSTRELLIQHAAATIAEAGPDAIVLRELAAACECSTSTIYTLFGGRDELIGAVIEHVVQSFTAAQAGVPHTADPGHDLMALGKAYRRWALENPAFYAVMFSRSPEPECDVDQASPDAAMEPLFTHVGRCMATGTLTRGGAEQIALSIWAGVHGWVTLELGGMTPQGPRKSAAAFNRHLESLADGWR